MTRTHWLLAALSFTDFIRATFVMTFVGFSGAVGSWYGGDTWCKVCSTEETHGARYVMWPESQASKVHLFSLDEDLVSRDLAELPSDSIMEYPEYRSVDLVNTLHPLDQRHTALPTLHDVLSHPHNDSSGPEAPCYGLLQQLQDETGQA